MNEGGRGGIGCVWTTTITAAWNSSRWGKIDGEPEEGIAQTHSAKRPSTNANAVAKNSHRHPCFRTNNALVRPAGWTTAVWLNGLRRSAGWLLLLLAMAHFSLAQLAWPYSPSWRLWPAKPTAEAWGQWRAGGGGSRRGRRSRRHVASPPPVLTSSSATYSPSHCPSCYSRMSQVADSTSLVRRLALRLTTPNVTLTDEVPSPRNSSKSAISSRHRWDEAL